MFHYDEKKFFHQEMKPECAPPHPHKHFSLPEQVECTSRELRATLERFMHLERTLTEKYDDHMRILTEDNVTFKTVMENAWSDFVSAVRSEINLFETNTDAIVAIFKQAVNGRIEEFNEEFAQNFEDYQLHMNTWKEEMAAEIASAVSYMKTNLSSTMRNAVNELIDEGVIDTIAIDAYRELVKDVYGVAFTDEVIEQIKTVKTLDTFIVEQSNAVYDFKGATINNLTINTTGATIKNAIVNNCQVLEGSRNCSFDNVRFENDIQCVTFGANTWAFNFRDCSFIGGGNTVAMNAGENTNTTLILTNCYFYKCKKIIYATGGFVCSIIGGWADHAEQIIHTTGGNCEICINGFDFEALVNVFKADSYTYTNISVNGVVGIIENVVDYSAGMVNLTYNAAVNGNVNLFSDNCPVTHYCNVETADGCKYHFNGSSAEKVISTYLPPLATVMILNNCYVGKIVFNNPDADVYTKYGKYNSGETLNTVTPVYVKNEADAGNNISLTITTFNHI